MTCAILGSRCSFYEARQSLAYPLTFGHARGSMTLDTYSHVLLDNSEADYAELLA